MKDPVCGAQVDEKTASASSSYQGQKYAFCGMACKQKFDQSPQRYASSGQGSQQHQSQETHQGQRSTR